MKILKTLFVALLLSCPLFGQAPNYPYTTLIVPQVLIPGNCSGKVVAADGTGCVTGGGGSGTVSGQANNVIPLATGPTTIGAQSHLTDSGNGTIATGAGTNSNGTPLVYTGSGLNDATITGTYNCSIASNAYDIYIDSTGSTDQFGANNDQLEIDNIPMTGSPQPLFCGLFVTFGHTTGHTADDNWAATATSSITATPFRVQNFVGPVTSAIFQPDGSVSSPYFYTQGMLGNLAVGYGSLQVQVTTNPTPAHGSDYHNTAIGQASMYALTSGVHNTAVGTQTLTAATTASYNTAMGEVSLLYCTTCQLNAVVGDGTGTPITGNFNTGIGANALGDFNGPPININGNVALGFQAGRFITTDNNFVVDNKLESTNANEVAASLLYGKFSGGSPGVSAGQFLRVNGGLQSGGTQSVTGCSLTSPLGGTQAGSFHAGATSCTITITPGFTATNGFACTASDLTTPADSLKQSAYNGTTATMTGTVASSDLITWLCMAF